MSSLDAMSFAVLFPWAVPLAKKLGVQFIDKQILDFFVKNTEEIIKMRIESNVVSPCKFHNARHNKLIPE